MLTRILVFVFGLGFLLVALGSLVLSTPIFSDLRQRIVADILSDHLGQPVHVRKDVRVSLGPISRVRAGGVQIPSADIDGTMLAELDLLELDLNLVKLAKGRFDVDNITIDGLRLNLLKLEDGTASWRPVVRPSTTPEPPPETPIGAEGVFELEEEFGFLGFLRDRTASIASIGVLWDNQVSGFLFDFELEYLTLEQLDGGDRLGVRGLGTVNDREFEIEGDYPTGAPFTTRATFGDLTASYNGIAIPHDQGGGHSAKLSLDIKSIGEFLDGVRLERSLEGIGSLSADLTRQQGLLKADNLSAMVELNKGQGLSASGDISNLLTAEGLDLQVDARFHPIGQPPAKAAKLKDLILTNISARVMKEGPEFELDDIVVRTNAFDQGLDRLGPVSVGRLYRTQDGTLGMEEIRLQGGPIDAPYFVAEGQILDLLAMKKLSFSWDLAMPATLVLDDLGEDVAAAFGGVEGNFVMDDSSGFLALTQMDLRTVNSDIWSMSAQSKLGNVARIDELELDFDLGIPDGASFLKALNLKEVETGFLKVSTSARKQGTNIKTTLELSAGGSSLDASLDATVSDGRPIIDGYLISQGVDIDDVKNIASGLVELSRLRDGKREDSHANEEIVEHAEPEVQPLVLPETEQSTSELVDLDQLFRDTDLNVKIDIKEITGQEGLSTIASEFVARDGRAQLGPLEINYGGGHFNAEATMDLVDTPEIISISGATKGWDFGTILNEIGLNIEAHGKLNGDFSLTGNRTSVDAFLNSMYGSASVFMTDGDIATSLLELAGLGIFPWLFSEELKQGYTDIVCIVAPVQIDAGKVNFDSVVVETESVQLVAQGSVDWKEDVISLRAEPRRVGKPLARSALPFEVSGKLTDPKFKLDVGGSRSERADAADDMPDDRRPCIPDIRQLE